jgi:hypothetical protein
MNMKESDMRRKSPLYIMTGNIIMTAMLKKV